MIVRKITNVLASILIIIVLMTYFYNKFNILKLPNILFYSINETNYIKEKEDYCLDIFIYNKIDINSLDFYYKNDSEKIKIDIKNINFNGETLLNNNIYNSYSIKVLNENINYNELFIKYNDQFYLINLNKYIINNIDKELIEYSYLKGHFAYINNNLYLIGLTIKLDNELLLESSYLTDNMYIINDLIKEEKKEDNIISEIHDYHKESKNNYLLKKDKYYYLPIGYKKLILENSNNLIINDKKIELIDFINSTKHLNDYPSYLYKGIVYDKN